MAAVVRDVVCGTDLGKERYAFSIDYKGQTYHFCSMGCRWTFEADPQRYARSVLSRALRGLAGLLRSTGDDGEAKCC